MLSELPATPYQLGRVGLPTAYTNKSNEQEILDNLQSVSVINTLYIEFKFSEAGLKRLLSMPGVMKCENLDLRGSPYFTEDCFLLMESFSRLKKLTPSNGFATPKGLAALGKLPLNDLNLVAARVTDDSLEVLGRHSTMETLDISGTPVTDRGLTHLHVSKSLKTLNVSKTKVTAAGVAALQKALPNCKIEWDDPAKAAPPTPAPTK